MPEENTNAPAGLTGIGLRLFFFFLLEIVALVIFSTLLDEVAGRLAAGAMAISRFRRRSSRVICPWCRRPLREDGEGEGESVHGGVVLQMT